MVVETKEAPCLSDQRESKPPANPVESGIIVARTATGDIDEEYVEVSESVPPTGRCEANPYRRSVARRLPAKGLLPVGAIRTKRRRWHRTQGHTMNDSDRVLDEMRSLLTEVRRTKLRSRHDLQGIPKNGLYVFYADGDPMYMGRSNRLGGRVQENGRPVSKSNSANFAFNLAYAIL